MASLAAVGTAQPAFQAAAPAQDPPKVKATKQFDVIVIPSSKCSKCQILFKVYKRIVGLEEFLKGDNDLVWLHEINITKPTTLHVTVPACAMAYQMSVNTGNGVYRGVKWDEKFNSAAVKIYTDRSQHGHFKKTQEVLPKNAEEQTVVIKDDVSYVEDKSSYRGFLRPTIGDGVL